MTQRTLSPGLFRGRQTQSGPFALRALATSVGLVCAMSVTQLSHAQANYPVSAQQKATAQQVAQAGVPISELAPNAPDSYTVKRRDTLWDISKLFLKSPWRWPELWGMNLQQIKNPHLIFPGQILYLDKSDGKARLRVAQQVGTTVGPNGTVKLSPRVREGALDDAITTVPVHLLEAFFNEAVIFDTSEELIKAPRVVATQEGRVLLSRGETAYVRGEIGGRRDWRLFREPKPLRDPSTKEVLGFEAAYVGTLELMKEGIEGTGADGQPVVIPSTFVVSTFKQEAATGDRLAPVPPREFDNLVPHAPKSEMAGQIASIYGESLVAGQNQIVTLNRGARHGVERGHVLALWRDGVMAKDPETGQAIKLPDERHGLLFVFRVFDNMSYALILSVLEPVKAGDRFTQP